jgi:hypothetical protein
MSGHRINPDFFKENVKKLQNFSLMGKTQHFSHIGQKTQHFSLSGQNFSLSGFFSFIFPMVVKHLPLILLRNIMKNHHFLAG